MYTKVLMFPSVSFVCLFILRLLNFKIKHDTTSDFYPVESAVLKLELDCKSIKSKVELRLY